MEKKFFKYLAVIVILCFKAYCAPSASPSASSSTAPAYQSPSQPLRLQYQSCIGTNVKKAVPIINMICNNNDSQCVFPESYVNTDPAAPAASVSDTSSNPIVDLLIDADVNFQTNANNINTKLNNDITNLKIPVFLDPTKLAATTKSLNDLAFLQQLVTSEFKGSPLSVTTDTVAPYYASWSTLCGINSTNNGIAQIILPPPSAPFIGSCGTASTCVTPFVTIAAAEQQTPGPVATVSAYNYCNNVYNFFNNNYSAGNNVGIYFPYNTISTYGSKYFSPATITANYTAASCSGSKITKAVCNTIGSNYSTTGTCSNVNFSDCKANGGTHTASSCNLVSGTQNNPVTGSMGLVNSKTDKILCQSAGGANAWVSGTSGSNCILNDINKCHSIMGVYNSSTGSCTNMLENNCSYYSNNYIVNKGLPGSLICVGSNLTDASATNGPLNSSSSVGSSQIATAKSYCNAGINSLNSSMSGIVNSFNTAMQAYNKSLNDQYANFTETVQAAISKQSALDSSLNQFIYNLYLWNIASVIRDALGNSSNLAFDPAKIQINSRCSLFNPLNASATSGVSFISNTCDNSASNDYSANYKNTLAEYQIQYANWSAKSVPDIRGNLVYKDANYEALFKALVSFDVAAKSNWSASRPDLKNVIDFLSSTAASKTKINNLYDYLSYSQNSTNKPTNLATYCFGTSTTTKNNCTYAGGTLSASNACNCPKAQTGSQFFDYIGQTCGSQVNDFQAVSEILYQKLAGASSTESDAWFNNLKPVFSIDLNNQFVTNNYYTQNSAILNNYISQSLVYLMRKIQSLCGSSSSSFLLNSKYFNKSLKDLTNSLADIGNLNNLLLAGMVGHMASGLEFKYIKGIFRKLSTKIKGVKRLIRKTIKNIEDKISSKNSSATQAKDKPSSADSAFEQDLNKAIEQEISSPTSANAGENAGENLLEEQAATDQALAGADLVPSTSSTTVDDSLESLGKNVEGELGSTIRVGEADVPIIDIKDV